MWFDVTDCVRTPILIKTSQGTFKYNPVTIEGCNQRIDIDSSGSIGSTSGSNVCTGFGNTDSKWCFRLNSTPLVSVGEEIVNFQFTNNRYFTLVMKKNNPHGQGLSNDIEGEVFFGSQSSGTVFLSDRKNAGIVAYRNPNNGDLYLQTVGFDTDMKLHWHTGIGPIYASLNDIIISDDPYVTAPESGDGGGYGDFDYKSDIIGLPTAPSISVSDSGFITLYKPTLQQLQDLAAYMWSGLFDMATFRKLFADPMDCIISLSLVPVSPTAPGSQELKVGNIGTGLTIDKLANQFVEVNFAALNIGLRTNGFMDFSPYTKAQIFLPFIGTRSISIDDIAGRSVKLKYIIDLFTGACNASLAAEVTAKDGTKQYTTLYQFTGNVLADIPITANNFASFLQATVGAVSTAIGVATGAGAISGIASAINSAASMKPDIEKSGNLSATAGFLGIQKPYLILTYPNLCRPEGRNKVVGTPSFLGMKSGKKLSSFHGFTVLHKVNVKGISCTEEEKELIRAQLTGEGVIMP